MRRLTLTVVLACALCGMARAGEVPSTGATQPPPPPQSSVSTSGEIISTDATTLESADTLLTLILTLISFS
jgi:hypothetical protein